MLILSVMVTPAALAVFQLGGAMGECSSGFSGSASLVMYGEIARASPDDAWRQQRRFRRRLLIGFGVICAMVAAVLPALVHLLAGPAFTQSAVIGRWLLPCVWVAAIPPLSPQWITRGIFLLNSVLTGVTAVITLCSRLCPHRTVGIIAPVIVTYAVSLICVLPVQGLFVLYSGAAAPQAAMEFDKIGITSMKRSHRQFIKEWLLRISDKIDEACRTADPLVPPKYLYHRYGGGNIQALGLETFRLLLDKCGLGRDAKVLEIGSGIGRNALPLTAFLAADGSYDGFDVMKIGIDYCTDHVTSRFGNFHFTWIDLQSSFYNEAGAQNAWEFAFPYADASFDVVFSASVYTHLQPAIVKRYLSETARVLKPGRCALNTFFLLNDEARERVAQGASYIKFKHQMDGYLTTRRDIPEEAIAIPEETIASFHTECGLSRPTISYGSWCGRSRFEVFQDVVVSRKENPPAC